MFIKIVKINQSWKNLQYKDSAGKCLRMKISAAASASALQFHARKSAKKALHTKS